MSKRARKRWSGILIFLIGWGCLSAAQGGTYSEIEKRRTPIVKVVQKASPSVVNISSQKIVQRRVSPFGGLGDPFFDSFFKNFLAPEFIQRYKLKTLGSGIVFNDGTLIITNQHVINQAEEISIITNKGDRYSAKVIGSDEVTDLAVLKLKEGVHLPPIPLGTSSDLMIGETVIAIGNPFGLSNTVTVGVISSLHRSLHNEGRIYKDLIQTDASINPGNSGGPLLNILGKAIGLNTAIYSNAQGIGFAIPIDKVKKISHALIEYGNVPPVWFGIDCQSLTPTIARHFNFKGEKGILVTAIEKGSPAFLAHIKPGDIIISIDTDPVSSPLMFQQVLNQHLPGDSITLRVARNGKLEKLPLTLKRLTMPHGAFLVRRIFGFDIRRLTRRQERLLKRAGIRGVVISEVIPNSLATRNGLRKGDILIRLNGIPVNTPQSFRKVLVKNMRAGIFELVVIRGSYTYKIILNIYES